MEEALAYNKEHAKEESNQSSLFGIMEDSSSVPTLRLKDAPPASKSECLAWEKELLGLYISGHPLDAHKATLEKNGVSIQKIKEKGEGTIVVAAGIVEDIREITTKKGERMAFVRLADYDDSIEMVVFPKVFFSFKDLFSDKEKCIKVKGRISERNGEKSIIVEAAKPL